MTTGPPTGNILLKTAPETPRSMNFGIAWRTRVAPESSSEPLMAMGALRAASTMA